MNWYLKVVRDNYANFQGRATRKEYWMFVLFNILFGFSAMILDNILFGYKYDSLGFIWLLYVLAIFIPSLGVTIRRLHDTDRTAWWLLFGIIPLVGPLVLLIFVCTDSTQGNNKYGPQPEKVFSTAEKYPTKSVSESPSSLADTTVVETDATVVGSSVEPITLTIETGPNAGSFFPISSDTTIGRANDNDIVLNVKTVSGYHCKISIEDGQFILRDLDSTNGTKVNDRKAKKSIIKPGKNIELSSVKITVS